jgi:NAD(P)-dependent dehydrogenase (short-subunit alcohol dehydrogenase family)
MANQQASYKEGMLRSDALKGINIIVTGGGTGLGKSMAAYFLKLGAGVCITSRKQEVLDNTTKELAESTGGKIISIACDVRDYDSVEKMIADSANQLGGLHSVVNNAAGNFISPTERLSPRAFNTIVDIVLKGTVNMTLAAGKQWINNKEKGNFLNIVTTYAWTGSGYVVPSATAKAGVLALTKSLAVEWAKYGIRSNAIAPGPFPTKGAWQRLLPEPLAKDIDPVKRIPLGRMGDHQELANLAAYLISDYSSYVNGEVITLDGGEWLKGAGQFSGLEIVTDEMWDALEAFRKAGKP